MSDIIVLGGIADPGEANLPVVVDGPTNPPSWGRTFWSIKIRLMFSSLYSRQCFALSNSPPLSTSFSFILPWIECILAGADKLGLMGKPLCKIINR